MNRPFARSFRLMVFLLLADLCLSPWVCGTEITYDQKAKTIKAVSIDDTDNVHLDYDDGSKQQATTDGHCEQVKVTDNHQIAGWVLSEKMQVDTPIGREDRILSKLIVYKSGRIICAIDPNVRIQAWRFWQDATQAVLKAAPPQGKAFYSLYSIPGAHEVDRVDDTSDTQLLPEWAHFAPDAIKSESKDTTQKTPAVTPDMPAPPRIVKKVAIIALGKDKSISSDVEYGIKEHLGEYGVQAASVRTLFPSTRPVSDIIEQLRTEGYDTILCLAPRKTIQFKTPASTAKTALMEDCLNTYVTGSYRSGEPLEVAPLSEERILPEGSANVSRSPIPSNPGAAPIRVNKGTVQFFDLASGALFWNSSVQAKMPAELQEPLQVKLITRSVWQVIEKSGLLPPRT